jgi:hypothetical protein
MLLLSDAGKRNLGLWAAFDLDLLVYSGYTLEHAP